MKHLLWLIAVCGMGAAMQWYYPHKYEPQLAALQQEVDQANKERDEANSALNKAQEDAETAIKKLVEVQAQLPQSIVHTPVLEHPVAPTAVDPKQAIRDAAKGEKVAELVTASKTYHDVTIKSVDPSAIEIMFADGAAHIRFEDLSQEWKDRFQYDPAEAKAFLAKKAAQDAQTDAALQKQLAIAAQAEAQKCKQQISSNGETIAQIQAQIKTLQDELKTVQERHYRWINFHKGYYDHPWHEGDIPDEISEAAIQELQRSVEGSQFQLSSLGVAP